MKSPVTIFCWIESPFQQTLDTSPTIFARNSMSLTFLVTHGPNFALGNFSTPESSIAAAAAVVPSPDVVDHLLCPSSAVAGTSAEWLVDAQNDEDSSGVLSVADLGVGGASGLILGTSFETPLMLDMDHPFLSVGIVNWNSNNENDDGVVVPKYWAGLTWNLSSFLPQDNDGGFNMKAENAAVYTIRYGDEDGTTTNDVTTTRCEDKSAITLIPVDMTNFTAADVPTLTCQSHHWADREIAQAKRTTKIVAAVLGSCLGVAVLALLALGLFVARWMRRDNNGPKPAEAAVAES
jgi:hypothetical protein